VRKSGTEKLLDKLSRFNTNTNVTDDGRTNKVKQLPGPPMEN